MVLAMFRHRLAEARRLADEAERAAEASESPEVHQTALLATAFFRGVESAYAREIEGIEDAIEFQKNLSRQAGDDRGDRGDRDYNVN